MEVSWWRLGVGGGRGEGGWSSSICLKYFFLYSNVYHVENTPSPCLFCLAVKRPEVDISFFVFLAEELRNQILNDLASPYISAGPPCFFCHLLTTPFLEVHIHVHVLLVEVAISETQQKGV